MRGKQWISSILCMVLFGSSGCTKTPSVTESTAVSSAAQNMTELVDDSYLMFQKNNVMVASTAVFLFHEDNDRINFNMTVQNGSDHPIAAMPVFEDLVVEGDVTVKEIRPVEPEEAVVPAGGQTGITLDLILEGNADPKDLIAVTGLITVNDADGNPLDEKQNFAVVMNKDEYVAAPEMAQRTTKVETPFAVYEIPDQIPGIGGEITQLYYLVQEDTVRQSISPDFMSDYFSVYIRDLGDYEFYFDGQTVPADISLEELNDTIMKWRSDPEKAGEYLINEYKETSREKMTIGGKDALRVVSEYVMTDSTQKIYSDITFVASAEGRVLSIVNSGYADKYEMYADAVKKVRETITFPAGE